MNENKSSDLALVQGRDPAPAPVTIVVAQHVEEAAHLRAVRSRLARAPNVRLGQLARLDERIAAHLDGVAIARGHGVELVHRALERPLTGEVFVATVRAIEDRDDARIGRLLALAQALPTARAGLFSGFGWVSAANLQGITVPLLTSDDAWPREVAIAACAMHGVDPGGVLTRAVRDDDAGLRTRALRAAGQCGRRDLTDACVAGMTDPDQRRAFEAARAALYLGVRREALTTLEALAAEEALSSETRDAALLLLLKAVSADRARSILSALAKLPGQIRSVIRGVASAGDPHYVQWLIAQASEPKLARLAGEAFSFLTGVDIAALELVRDSGPVRPDGPSDDPEDDDIAMDEDEGLPWPAAEKLDAWWHKNSSHFAPGRRYFAGGEPTPDRCLSVLRTGVQRERFAAAEHRTLATPGTPLFNVVAPSWRQQRLLDRLPPSA
ncbi:MAG: TIGR02270 family protein [Pseudomonadota bacterium]|nr:TIGR02270 family protein [Pseudomonadota bacterium]